MASPNPVPSRAALNALRGFFFTTSCSVFLLAEERRSRLEIARGAIDNARKLRVARSNRGPIALSSEDAADETSPRPIPERLKSSTRRRRRRNAPGHRHNPSPSELRTSHTRFNRPRSYAWVPKMLQLSSLRPPPSKMLPHHRNIKWWPPIAFPTPRISRRTRKRLNRDSPPPTSSGLSPSEAQPHGLEPAAGEGLSHAVEAARLYLDPPTQGGPTRRPCYGKAQVVLRQLLQDLETRCVGQAGFSETLTSATAILERLASFGPPMAETLDRVRCEAFDLLRIAVDSDRPEATAILDALLRLCNDPLHVLVPLLKFIPEDKSNKYMQEALDYFSSGRRGKWPWRHGMLIRRILAKSLERFQDVKQAYQAMQVSGLFQEYGIPHDTEYEIRQLMVMKAIDQGDDAFVHTEMQAIHELDADAPKFDMLLRSKLVVRDADLGKWASVYSHVEELSRIFDSSCFQFQTMLVKVTDVFAKGHSPEELETFLRSLVVEYRIRLRHRWVFRIVDGYASRHEVDSVFSWLGFCCDSGLCMNEAFVQAFCARCRKYWSFSDKSVAKLQNSLRRFTPADSSGDSGVGADGVNHGGIAGPGSRQPEASEDCRTASPARPDGNGTDDGHGSGSASSGRSLRMAVVELLGADDAGVDSAISLVRAAHAKGDDITAAMTPLLLARLRRGDSPKELIKEARSMVARLHDSAYNKAAQALSARGDLQGAAEMCMLAARENGKGEVLYNEYNFANLVFAYTGSGRYGALHALLSRFTSQVLWWHGSRTCKESLKLAMKTAAMRTVVHTEKRARHKLALDRLDESLQHVKLCRSNRSHRQAVAEAFVRIFEASSSSPLATATATTAAAKRGVDEAEQEEDACSDGGSSAHTVESLEPVARPLLAATTGGG